MYFCWLLQLKGRKEILNACKFCTESTILIGCELTRTRSQEAFPQYSEDWMVCVHISSRGTNCFVGLCMWRLITVSSVCHDITLVATQAEHLFPTPVPVPERSCFGTTKTPGLCPRDQLPQSRRLGWNLFTPQSVCHLSYFSSFPFLFAL